MKIYDALQDPAEMVRRINVYFYDLVYADSQLAPYFAAVDKAFLAQQQTDFIVGAIGGPRRFSGRAPSSAHVHMMVTGELFDHRTSLLRRSFENASAPAALVEAWLRIDEAHRGAVVKSSVAECRPRWRGDEVLDFRASAARRPAS